MTDAPRLGSLIADGDRRRDAVHVAVAPATAAERLFPGQHVGFATDDSFERVTGTAAAKVGIVDPYLTAEVNPGQRFWLFLYPNTLTSLRHSWTHPAFAAARLRKAVAGGPD